MKHEKLLSGLALTAALLVTGCAGVRTAYRPTCCPTPTLVGAAPVGVAPAPCCNGGAPAAAIPGPPPPAPGAFRY